MTRKKNSQLKRILYEIYRDADVDRLYDYLQNHRVKITVTKLVGRFPTATNKTVALTDFDGVFLSNSKNFSRCRKQVSVIHEFLHLYNQEYGKNWSHDYIRSIAHALNPCSVSCDCTY